MRQFKGAAIKLPIVKQDLVTKPSFYNCNSTGLFDRKIKYSAKRIYYFRFEF